MNGSLFAKDRLVRLVLSLRYRLNSDPDLRTVMTLDWTDTLNSHETSARAPGDLNSLLAPNACASVIGLVSPFELTTAASDAFVLC